MPFVERPDGARIRYETYGSGYPVLCFAPGGVNSQVDFWERSIINPIRDFSGEFQVIAMDQRNVGQSTGNLEPFSWDVAVADQLAVLDELGISQAHVMGGCIGVAASLRIIQEAPDRITAAVGQDPVGLDETNSIDTFLAMFQPTLQLAREQGVPAVVESAHKNPVFVTNNQAGPFAQRIATDDAFRKQVEALSADEYAKLIEDYARGIWPDNPPFMSVPAEFVPKCPAPLLIIPGSDPFHPTGIGQRICREAPNARCLDVDARSDETLPGTLDAIRAFFRQHAK